MEWLTYLTMPMMFIVILNWFVINRSYYFNNKEKYFKSRYHRLFDDVINAITMVLAVLIVIKWVFF